MTEDLFELGKTHFTPEQIEEMMSPTLAKQREQEKRHQEFLMQVLSGDCEDNAGPYKLRCIVEHDSWYLPVKSDGRFEILNLHAGEFDRLIAAPSKTDGRRTNRTGKGGQFIPVKFDLPDDGGSYRKLDGRQLARCAFPQTVGLLIQNNDDDNPRELSHEYFAELAVLADAVELEDELMTDGPIKTSCLNRFEFLVATYKDKLWLKDGVATIGTHADSLFLNDDELRTKRMTGETVFKMTLNEPAFCGVVINPGHAIGRKGGEFIGLVLSLSHISQAMKQDHLSLSRAPNWFVRNKEEFEIWLGHVYFPSPFEVIEDTDSNGRRFIHAVSCAADSRWSIYESLSCEPKCRVTTPRFEMKQAPGNTDEIAEGVSPILCPALIAKSLYLQLPQRARKTDQRWSPGKSLGVARLLSSDDISASKRRVKLANELLKFMPAGIDTIPREAIRSVDGACFLSGTSFAVTRAWVLDQLNQAKRFDKRIVF